MGSGAKLVSGAQILVQGPLSVQLVDSSEGDRLVRVGEIVSVTFSENGIIVKPVTGVQVEKQSVRGSMSVLIVNSCKANRLARVGHSSTFCWESMFWKNGH